MKLIILLTGLFTFIFHATGYFSWIPALILAFLAAVCLAVTTK